MNTHEVQPHDAPADAAARAIAAWLTPYIAAELGGEAPVLADRPEDYDTRTCREFVSTLGDKVLRNSRTFFSAIVDRGEVGSLELASLMGVGSPRNIPAILTTPLKRRAKAMGRGNPWRESVDHTNRTVWVSKDGVAKRMLSAVDAEIHRRRGGEAR
jgi:hypothetical protein